MSETEFDILGFGIQMKLEEYEVDSDEAEKYRKAIAERVENAYYDNQEEMLRDLEKLFTEDPFNTLKHGLPRSEDPEELGEELYDAVIQQLRETK